MRSFDFLIIYLTCGAPFGVYYFLQNRKKCNHLSLSAKTAATFLFWLPFGFRLLIEKSNEIFTVTKKLRRKSANTKIEVIQFQKQFEAIFHRGNLQCSIFDFREIFERYVGLTIASGCQKTKNAATENELIRLVNKENIETGTICLNRRNLKRLTIHQIRARRELLQLVKELMTFIREREEFEKNAKRFFRFLNDTEAITCLENMLSEKFSREENFSFENSENDLWKTPTSKMPTAQSLMNLSATTNLSAKD